MISVNDVIVDVYDVMRRDKVIVWNGNEEVQRVYEVIKENM